MTLLTDEAVADKPVEIAAARRRAPAAAARNRIFTMLFVVVLALLPAAADARVLDHARQLHRSL